MAKQCWYISDRLHTSYSDVLDLSVAERVMLMEFMKEKDELTKREMDRLAEERKARRGK